MAIRLDPKYHGVRVARVRPKDIAMTIKPGSVIKHGTLWVNATSCLQFRKSKVFPEWEPRLVFAYINKVTYLNDEIFQALEALGLR